MKTYFINTYREEESQAVIRVLNELGIADYRRKKAIMNYETIDFKTSKDVWKQIKQRLHLQVTTVFSKIKVEL